MRGGDQLTEIGGAMPNGFIGIGGSVQQNPACIESACAKQSHDVAQAAMIVISSGTIDKPYLMVDAEVPRERAYKLRRKSEHARTAPVVAEQHM